MTQKLSVIFLLPSRFTVDHPSDRIIPINALSKLKQTNTDLRSSIQRRLQNSVTIVFVGSEIPEV